MLVENERGDRLLEIIECDEASDAIDARLTQLEFAK